MARYIPNQRSPGLPRLSYTPGVVCSIQLAIGKAEHLVGFYLGWLIPGFDQSWCTPSHCQVNKEGTGGTRTVYANIGQSGGYSDADINI